MDYEIRLYNISRCVDIGKISAFISKHSPVTHALEDMDTCTPESRTSNVWRLTFRLAGCPAFLRGVVRLDWLGTTIILKHPSIGRRLQCFRCGNVGHTLARCGYSDEQLIGVGCLVATEQEIVALDDVAKPFANFEEMQAGGLQAPYRSRNGGGFKARASTSANGGGPHGLRSYGRRRGANAAYPHSCHCHRGYGFYDPCSAAPPKPKNKWITVPIRGRRGLFAHQRRPQPENVNAPTRYDVLAGQRTDAVDEEEQETQELQVEEAVISELPATGETTGTPVPTAAELAQLRVLKKKPPPMLAEPQLMGLIQRERAHLLRLTVPCQSDRQPLAPLIRPTDTAFRSVDDMVDRLQLRAVPTPATGNCMAMAIVQALSDSALTAQDTKLAEATGSLKRGIKYAGQLHLAEQFPHGTRVATLIAVRRGWAGMGPVASKQQFRWYLEEYGRSPSERNASVTAHNWGGCDTLCMAAKFLRRNIYVIAKGGAGSGDWHCSLYRLSSMSRHNKLIETGEQVILTAEECGRLIAQDKLQEEGQAPLVLRYHDNHYSACIHQHGVRPTSASGSGVGTGAHNLGESASSDVVMSAADGALSTWAAITPVVANDAIIVGNHFDPWNTDLGAGILDELHARCDGLSIPHRLKSAIHQILRVPDPQRFREMLTFLTSTVPHLEPSVQERLAHTDMKDATNIDVIQLQQQLHIAPCVVQQWQTFLQVSATVG